MNCPLCDRIELLGSNKYPFKIHEFKNSFLSLGEHQFYKGYSVLVTKNHYKEMTDIPSPEREEIFKELMISSKAIQNVLNPTKMNLCSLGNVVPHLHWHLFPRFEHDEHFKNPPWLQMNQFQNAPTILENVKNLIHSIEIEILKMC